MSARLYALRDNGVATVRLEPLCFSYASRRRKNLDVVPLEALDQVGCGQPKMKTHDLRLQLFNNAAHLFIEWKSKAAFRNALAVETQALIVRS